MEARKKLQWCGNERSWQRVVAHLTIQSFSHASAWQRLARWVLPCYWLAAASATHLPPPPEPEPAWPHQDKLYHFGGYLALGLLLGMAAGVRAMSAPSTAGIPPAEREAEFYMPAALPTTPWPAPRNLGWAARRRWLGLLAILGVYAALDELTQPLFARDAELLDWLADIGGSALGLLLAQWVLNRR